MKNGKWPLIAAAAVAVAVAVVGVVRRNKPNRGFTLSTDPEVAQVRKLLASLYVMDDAGLVRFLNYDAEPMDLPEDIAAAVSKHRDGGENLTVAALMAMLEKAGEVTSNELLMQLDAGTQKAMLRQGYKLGGLSVWAGRWWHLNQDSPNMEEFERVLAEHIK